MMKRFLIFCGIVLTMNCCTDEESDREFVIRMLTNKEWRMLEARIGEKDVSTEYDRFTLAFSNSDFRAQNGGELWPAEGTWEFEDVTSRAMVRSDGIIIEIRHIDENQLVLSGQWDIITDPEDRLKQTMNAHSFTFTAE